MIFSFSFSITKSVSLFHAPPHPPKKVKKNSFNVWSQQKEATTGFWFLVTLSAQQDPYVSHDNLDGPLRNIGRSRSHHGPRTQAMRIKRLYIEPPHAIFSFSLLEIAKPFISVDISLRRLRRTHFDPQFGLGFRLPISN